MCLLTRKYLSKLKIAHTRCLSNEYLLQHKNKETFDLAISNFGFSEISREEQQIYIDQVLNKSKSGYLTCNFINHLYGIDSLTLDEITRALKIPGRTVKVLPEEPSTSSKIPNVLILWTEEEDLSSYVSTRIYGQLGNQLFQIATAYAYSLDHAVPLVIPDLIHQRGQDIPQNAQRLFLRKIAAYDLTAPTLKWNEPCHPIPPARRRDWMVFNLVNIELKS